MTADAAKLYKWVDEQGNISYQDQPPPENAKVLDEKEVKGSGAASQSSDGAQKKLPVFVYVVDNCPNCEGIILHLKKHGVPHVERSLKDDRVAQSKILKTSNSITAPVVFIGDKILQAPAPAELNSKLQNAGYKVTVTDKK